MVVPALLFLLSSALAGFALMRQGAVLSDMLLLTLVMGAASLILLVLQGGRGTLPPQGQAAGDRPPGQSIVVDGSNVMHWRDETPQIATVLAVVEALKQRGFRPGVVFDANAGYKLFGRYQDDRHLAYLLDLPEAQVLVVPKGTPADPYLLQAARDLGARVVTNDRFRDWADKHPEVREPGFLIRGGYRDGALWLQETKRAPVH